MIVSGCIFVMTTWKYLPEFAKQIILFTMSVGLLAGSGMAEKKWDKPIAESALFYLGTAFAGFTLLSFLGGWNYFPLDLQSNASNWMIADIVMLALMGYRTYRTEKAIDFCVVAFLLDGIWICSIPAFRLGLDVSILLLGGCMLIYTVLYYMLYLRDEEHTGLGISLEIFYLLHVIMYVVMTAVAFFFADDTFYGFRVIAVALITLTSSVSYAASEKSMIRVFQSLSIFWLTLEIVMESNNWFAWTERDGMIAFTVFVLNLVIMVVLKRKEMFFIQFSYSLLYAIGAQMIQMIAHDWFEIYYPYSFATAVVLLVCCPVAKEWKFIYCKLAGLQAVIGILLFASWKWEICFILNLFLILAVTILMAAVFMNVYSKKQGLLTIALVLAQLGIIIQSVNWVHSVIIFCIFMGICIVLLGLIWYDREESIKSTQFGLTCMLMTIMLLNATITEDNPDVFALAIVGVIMLVVATIRNKKNYEILSALTLTMLVIYITRSFWLNIAWWVYLFVTGIVLVILAIRKENR